MEYGRKLAQISSELVFAKGREKINIDNAPFMGRKGRAPNPMQHCLLGIVACFLGTFATIAKELGLEISELSAEAEASINLSKPLDIGDEPINKGIKITLNIKSDEAEDKIEHAKKLAIERCPAVYCITNPIRLDVNMRK